MNNNKRNLKFIVFSLGLGVAMLITTSVQAQVINLLDEYYEELEQQSIQRDKHTMAVGRDLLRTSSDPEIGGSYILSNQQFYSNDVDEEEGFQLYNGGFGQNVPLGSGLLLLAAAGAGYAIKKRKTA